MKRLRKNDIQIIFGHGTFGLRELCPDAKYLTFVRHPVSHTFSNYNYIRTNPHNCFYELVQQLTFSEFIDRLEEIRHDNQHYRQLTNNLFRIEHPEFYSQKIVPDYNQLDYALHTIDYIFRFDEIDLAIEKQAKEFDWQYSEMDKMNVSIKEDINVTDEEIEKILKVNHLDWHIYIRAASLV